jgi:hypothetical protein
VTEQFLHYIWQHRLFDSRNLVTDEGSAVEILDPGIHNTGAGPDFFNARIRIGDTNWAGNVEIHINASEWQRHRHHSDAAYDGCILHVVEFRDAATVKSNGQSLPAIELKDRYPSFLWENYIALLGRQDWIPCVKQLGEIDRFTWESVFDGMSEERLRHRAENIFSDLITVKYDWEEIFYRHLCRNFGFQLNALPFEMLARSLPLRIIRKEAGIPMNVEALLFGQASMLETQGRDNYQNSLSDIYRHLRNKYGLIPIPPASWKYLRLRPVNFPAVRIAQLSRLLISQPFLFSRILSAGDTGNIFGILDVTASEYWDSHYRFNKESAKQPKRTGKSSIENIIINTAVPFIYSWGLYHGEKKFTEHAVEILAGIPSESNHIMEGWKAAGVKPVTARESQALLQLRMEHCSAKKCLNCIIGNKLINSLP